MAITQVSNSLVKQDLTISGGTVDNTVIGSGTPAAGTFTTVAGALASTVTGTTAAASDNSTKIATTAYVTTALANLVDSAPGTLNTLNELAAALGDDASFSTTVTTSIAAKLPLAGGTMTGNIAHASDFTIDVGGDISLDADGGDIRLLDGGTQFGKFTRSSGDFIISSSENDKDMKFAGADGGADITALTLDMSAGGAATFNAGATFSGSVSATSANISDDNNYSFGDGTTYIQGSGAADRIKFITAGAEAIRIDSSGNVGIGTSSPNSVSKLQVEDTTASNTSTYISVVSGNAGNAGIAFGDSDADLRGGILYNNDDDALRFFKSGFTEAMRINSGGKLTIGGTSTTRSLNIDGTADAYMSFNPSSHTKFTVGSDNSGFLIYDDAAGDYRMNINSSGTTIFTGPNSATMELRAPTDNAFINIYGGYNDSGAEEAGIKLYQNQTAKWQVGMPTTNDFRIYNYNTTSTALTIGGSNNYLVAQGASQVRLVLGSTGNSTNNTSNWVRGNGNELDFNSGGGVMNWEINGNKRMTLNTGGALDLLYGFHVNPNSSNNHTYAKFNRTAKGTNH